MKLLIAGLCTAAVATFDERVSLDAHDLKRARSKVPRAAWKGDSFDSMSRVLNKHLQKMFPQTLPCESWTVEELQAYQAMLLPHMHDELKKLYATASDNRRLRFSTEGEYKKHWERMKTLLARNSHLNTMHRDGHCHEAVMWLVHLVPSAVQHSLFSKAPVPMLSHQRHACNATHDGVELCQAYNMQISCSDCHSGTGITMQDYVNVDGKIPEDPKYPGWARQRRCDANWSPKCGPCEGIGGPYWGDSVDKFQPTNCELVALPENVPAKDRPLPQFPEEFIVHQLGSDRLARTQNNASFALYSQIRSTLWYSFPLGGKPSEGTATDGMAKLRHDTFYDDLPYRELEHGLVSEIHTQNREQRAANITGPMISLIHAFLGWGKYMGGCTCVADPVGVPVLGGTVINNGVQHSAFMNGAEYLGRIKIGVEYDGFKLGDSGHGDMTKKRNMTVDHYAKWFLHLFIDADKDSPTYGQPVRFYGPYSGFAVYVKVDEKAPPANVWTDACVDNGWGTPEFKPLKKCKGKKITDYGCMNVEKKHPEVCNLTAKENAAASELGDLLVGRFGSVRLPPPSQSIVV
jgi:hypothetical protein